MQHGACRALTCSSTSILRSAALSRTAYIDAPRGRCLIQLLMLISLVPTASSAIALPTRPVATAKAKRPHRDHHPLSPSPLPPSPPPSPPPSQRHWLAPHSSITKLLSCTHPRPLPSVAPVCTDWPCCLPKGPPPGSYTLPATRLRGGFICSTVIRACQQRARRSGGAARRPRT